MNKKEFDYFEEGSLTTEQSQMLTEARSYSGKADIAMKFAIICGCVCVLIGGYFASDFGGNNEDLTMDVVAASSVPCISGIALNMYFDKKADNRLNYLMDPTRGNAPLVSDIPEGARAHLMHA